MNNKPFIAGSVALAMAGLCSLGALAYLDTMRPSPAETCAVQVLNSEERIRDAIDAANRNVKGGYADLTLFLEMTLVQPVHGLKTPWQTDVSEGDAP